MNLSAIAIRRPVFTVMVTVALIVLGLTGLSRLGTDLFPDVSIPIVVVEVVYPGASPAEVETLITQPIEDEVASVNGIDRVLSTSREGQASISVLFELGVPIEEATTEVRERVAQVRSRLPPDVHEPVVSRVDTSAMPVAIYSVAGELPLPALRKFADDVIRPAIEQIDGVARVDIEGGTEREIHVDVDQVKLDALGIAPQTILRALQQGGLTVPAGRLTQGATEVSVRTVGELASVDALRALIIANAKDGSAVRLSDVAQIEDGFAEARERTFLNGAEAVSFEVVKQSGRNTVAVVDAVQKKLAEIGGDFPDEVRTTLILDTAQYIRENAHEVEVSIFYGGAMAIAIILLFMLDLRSTLISALALPTSVIATFFVMDLWGFTLNTMTLLGLSLAIGLLIDDAVVVRENIFKHLERGEPPMQAALEGTREVALAVLATTMTIVAVFVPVAFLEGIVGQFFKQFGLTVTASVLVSLFVAFTLDPMLSSRFSKPIDHTAPDRFAWLKRPLLGFFAWLDASYRGLLGWSLRHKALVGLFSLLALLGMAELTTVMGSDFVARQDRSQFNVDIELPAGASLEEAVRSSQIVSARLLADELITTVLSTAGAYGDSNRIHLRVLTVPKHARTIGITEIQDRARAVASGLAGAKVAITDVQLIEGAGFQAPIMINVRGESFETLSALAGQVAATLRSIPGVVDVDVKYAPGKSELRVAIDRERAADQGLSVASVASTLRLALEGDDSAKLRQGDDEVPIRVRLRSEDRATPADLLAVSLSSPRGLVALADVARIDGGTGPQRIEREDRTRQVAIWAAPHGRSLGDITQDLKERLAAIELPAGYSLSFDGQIRQMSETNAAGGKALLLGVIFIYLVLASQFESFIHPFTIMMTLPLALIGAISGLFMSGYTLSMSALIGVVLLMGLVTKNAILLVDRAIQRVRDRGEAPLAAMLEAGPERLRPILMTSAAMILGMLPTALSRGEGSEFRAPMAIVVIGGVISSTLLSLCVIPALYVAIEDGKARLSRRLSGRRRATEVSRA